MSVYRKTVNEMKEMKLLLDMYKGVGKEQRDKVQLMAAERKTRAELEDLRQQLKKIQVSINTPRKKSKKPSVFLSLAKQFVSFCLHYTLVEKSHK